MKKILLLATVSILSGCVSFTSENTPSLLYTGMNNNVNRPNVKLLVNTVSTKNNLTMPERQFEQNREFIEKIKLAFAMSNMYGEVSENASNPDYKLDVVVKDIYTDCPTCNFINYVTLGIIPSWNNNKFYYQANMTDMRSGKRAAFTYYEKSTEVRELLLAPAMPFVYDNVDKMHMGVFHKMALDVAGAK